jgi:hypothetical protein
LDELDIGVPTLDESLDSLDHPLIIKAQNVPEQVASNGGQRILCLTERIWYKTKVHDWRGAVASFAECPFEELGSPPFWWLGTAGKRRSDSSQSNFYDQLPADDSTRIPGDWDWRRWVAESALAGATAVQSTVRNAARESLKSGSTVSFYIAARSEIRIRIRIKDHEEAYLGVALVGIPDAKTFALILDSFPGVEGDDWQPEPGGVLDIEPDEGEMIFSTLLSVKAQHELFDGID